MPTKKPRVMLTLEEPDFAALNRLAALQHRPMAAVMRDFISQCAPIFDQISDALEAAQKMQANAPKDLLEKLEKAHDKAGPVLLDLLQVLQDVSDAGNSPTPA